jgi:hypothetical protein
VSVRDGLKSVNWTTGMLLTPDHFQRQDDFVESSFRWLLRYCTPGSGLVGGGVRVDGAHRVLGTCDPHVEVSDDGATVRVSVVQARGITPDGEPVEVDRGSVVSGDFARGELAGATELLVYLNVTGEREADPESIGRDAANPNQAAARRPRLQLLLGAEADEAVSSLVVGRIRRAAETLHFEVDGAFIPACVSVSAHSALHSAWARIHAEVVHLSGRFAQLHRMVARYVDQVARRGVDTRTDLDVLAFVERAVLALDGCAYETMDPALAPARLFREIDRAGRRVALALDLSAATQLFFTTLAGTDASYAVLLEEERNSLAAQRQISPRADLRESVARADATLVRLADLCQALEGKYVDYRVNRSVDSLRFLLDRDGDHFYMAVATPGHPQREGDLLTFVFSQMSLTGRHEYRVVLLGDPQGISSWQVGEELWVDLRVNSASGPGKPISRTAYCEVTGQRNFAVNFDTPPEIATLSGLQVTVHPGHRVRGAILFQRRLGLAAEATAASPAAPLSVEAPEPVLLPAGLEPEYEAEPTFRAPRIKLRRARP